MALIDQATLLRPIARETQRAARSIRWTEALAAAGDDAIALSVADMDFAAPQVVIDAVARRAQTGNFSYTYLSPEFYQSVCQWFSARHGWDITAEQIVSVGRVVEALPALLRRLTTPSAKIVVPYPAYGPIPTAVAASGREVVAWQLSFDGQYRFDLEALETLLAQGAEAIILTNPHNPTGRVWTGSELSKVAKLAAAHNALVISDEVHADLLRTGQTFTPYLTLVDAEASAIALTSPGKSFNLAGLEIANMVVPNPDLRAEVTAAVQAAGSHNPRFFAEVATIAAYSEGGPWLDELLALMDHHVGLVTQELATRLPQVTVIPAEGTYLLWLDCRTLGLSTEKLNQKLLGSGLVLTPGTAFGLGGEEFMRMNLAVPTQMLETAIDRFVTALQ
ncbi:PatB family C-S lyase [Jonesiaceae bacterium BS-20]|uniref:cysteine-S-conjugate beta-lyase n=1 Tax=Jonesiaceae bacterium BS-20 TaxID=3120821 RepID=A0AAU7DW27_9MICO